MKRILAFVLSLVVLMGFCIPVSAAEPENYGLTLYADGKATTEAKVGDIVTITLVIESPDGNAFDLYSMQDYICFDIEYVRYVEGSLSTYADANGNKVVYGSAIKFSADPIDYPNRVFVNRASLSGVSVESGAVLASFELEVVKEGTVTVSHDTIELFQTVDELYAVDQQDAKIVPETSSGGGDEPTPPVTPDPPVAEPDEPTEPEVSEWEIPYEVPDLVTDKHINYVVGYADDTIRPNNNITRAEVATIFYRLLTDECRAKYETTNNDFSDVSATDWHNKAVSTLANAGILNGYPDGTFGPNRNITRAELVTIIDRFAEAESGVADFNDVSGHWAVASIGTSQANGWVNGYPDGSFKPDNAITRAETFAVANRLLGRHVNDVNCLLSGMETFSDNLDTTKWYYFDVQEAANYHEYKRLGGTKYEKWTALVANIVY